MLPHLTKCYRYELMKMRTAGSHMDTTFQFRFELLLEHLSVLLQQFPPGTPMNENIHQ